MPALKNPRHERFAQELAKGHTQEDAYVEAGYNHSRSNACTLAADQNILERVAGIQERGALRSEVTVASLTEMLIEDRKMAREIAQPSASVAAVNAIAKLNGLIVEKTENTNKQVDNLTDEVLADIARAGSTGTDKKKSSPKGTGAVH